LGQDVPPLVKGPDYAIPIDFTIKIQMKSKKQIKLARTFDNKILEVKDVLNDPKSVYLKGLAEGVATLELISTDEEREEFSVYVLRQQTPVTNVKLLKGTTIDIEHLKKTINQVGLSSEPKKRELSVIPITTDSILIIGERDSKEDIKTILLLASKIVDPNYLEKEAGKVYEVDLQEDKDLLSGYNSGPIIQNISSPSPANMDKTSTKVSSKVINGIKFIKKESNFDFKLLQKTIKDVFPKSNIEVKLLTNDSVILMGYVSNAEDIPLIIRIAESIVDPALGQAQSQMFQGSSTTIPTNSLNSQNSQNGSTSQGNSSNPQSSPKVINVLRVAGVQQVQLDVVVAQVSRTEIRKLAFDFLSYSNSSFIGSTLSGLATRPLAMSPGSTLAANAFVASGASANVPFGVLNSSSGFLGFLQALRTETASKLLAEPKLVTSSGKKASFLVGGEQAVISAASGVNGPGVDFKKIGTQLEFLPVVLGNGKIQLTVNPSIKSVNVSLGIASPIPGGGFTPGFDDKQVTATVEMETGQTFVIGGLIQNETRGSTKKIPVLGDLPFLGVLFSSKDYSETEQEVVILVTPYLVDPQSSDQLPKLLPGQETRTPDDFELFLEGILEAPRGPRKVIQDRRYTPGFKNAKPLDVESGESRVPGNLIFPTRNQEIAIPKELPKIEINPIPLPVSLPEVSNSEKVREVPIVQIKNSRSSLPIKVLPGVAKPNNSESKIKSSSLQTLSPVK
jgi:Flp pilus assembly secretin CpaC